jgi:monovalent cation:H+ antiporter, CPA1 family
MTLQQELREYDQLTDDGLIGPELRQALMTQTGAARLAMAERPRLDLSLQKEDLVRRFPLFEKMDDTARNRLAERLRTQFAAPGECLMELDETPRCVWFIASGAVEMTQAGQVTRLGRGDMFGELSLLLGRRRRARVTAITHSTLLALDEADFLALLQRNDALSAAVRDSAAQRGVPLDLAALSPATGRTQLGRRLTDLLRGMATWRLR